VCSETPASNRESDVPPASPGTAALGERAAGLRQEMVDERLLHRAYTREVGDDMDDVRDWRWPGTRRAVT
jgi:phosphoketolase